MEARGGDNADEIAVSNSSQESGDGPFPAADASATPPSADLPVGAASSAELPAGANVSAAAMAARVVERAYRALVDAAQYPSLPPELTYEFLAGVDATALSAAEKAALTREYEADLRLTGLLDQLSTALRSRQAKLLIKDKDLYDLIGVKDGLRSFSDFRGKQSGKGARAAAQELDTAQTLVQTPSAQEAVDNGQITLDHVGALSKAASTVTRRGDEGFTPVEQVEQVELVEMGKGSTADEYEKALARYVNGRNPLAHDASHAQIRRRRFLHVSRTPAGAHIKGFLDPVSAQTLQVALEAATPKPAKDDDRDYGQRNADALEAIASLSLNTGELKAGALVRPHLSFIMTEKTYLAGTKELKRRTQLAAHQNKTARHSKAACGKTTDRRHLPSADTTGLGNPAGREDVDPELLEPVAMEPAEFEDGTAIPLNELTRLMCDAQITRIVLNAKDAPMNVGRTERYYTKELRRAIIARDKSCRFAECTMEARWSEVHHIQWWDKDDGETSIENGVLCCKFHHTQIHDGILEVTHDDQGLPQITLIKTKEPPGDNHQESVESNDPPREHSPPDGDDKPWEHGPPREKKAPDRDGRPWAEFERNYESERSYEFERSYESEPGAQTERSFDTSEFGKEPEAGTQYGDRTRVLEPENPQEPKVPARSFADLENKKADNKKSGHTQADLWGNLATKPHSRPVSESYQTSAMPRAEGAVPDGTVRRRSKTSKSRSLSS